MKTILISLTLLSTMILFLSGCDEKEKKTMIEANTLAPDFELEDQDGKSHKLSNYRGSNVLIYFYPKDDTPGCTKEACSIRDSYAQFENLELKIFGISADSVESHKKFAQKYNLPFTLLADTNKTVAKLYGADGALFVSRISFLINDKGEIIKTYPKVDPSTHAAEIYEDLSKIISEKK
jgi:thioredoxin-dependent peroxiredoxin